MKPSPETIETLRNIETEVGAGRVLIPRTEAEHTWNNAHERALSIIGGYKRGEGLFQMTAEMKRLREP